MLDKTDTFDLARAVDDLGLTTLDLCVVFGIASKTVYRWLGGENPVPKSVEHCLTAWIALRNAGLEWYPHTIPGVKCCAAGCDNGAAQNFPFVGGLCWTHTKELLASAKKKKP